MIEIDEKYMKISINLAELACIAMEQKNLSMAARLMLDAIKYLKQAINPGT